MTGGRWGVATPHDSVVISLTHDRRRSAEVCGVVRISWMSDMLWQSTEVGVVRLLPAVAANSCVSWDGNQPNGLLTGDSPCRSMLR